MKAILAQVVSYHVLNKPRKIMQHMHIPYMFDCSTNSVVLLLQLKSSMPYGKMFGLITAQTNFISFRSASMLKQKYLQNA